MRALIALLAYVWVTAAAAQEMKHPRVSHLPLDWGAALAAVEKIAALKDGAPRIAEAPAGDASDRAKLEVAEAIERLNHAAAERLPGIKASPVPVLLPFDVETYLRDRTAGTVDAGQADKYFSGFRAPKLFLTGPAGFDAAFTLRPRDVPALAGEVAHKDDAEVQFTGAAFVYEIDAPKGVSTKPTNGLEAEFPGIRRIYVESHMRYVFERYGAVYSLSILCFDGRARKKWITCRDADVIAAHFLKSLQLVGGSPQPRTEATPLPAIERPAERSKTFAYYGPGQLMRGTGYRKNGGDEDTTVYARIRFPLATGPAHTYSQMYVNPNDCAPETKAAHPVRRRGEILRCPPAEAVSENEAEKTQVPLFPWRDNFCEMRDFSVGQCPGGFGHQGQDIVPGGCRVEGDPATRCDPDRLTVVAAYDGTVLRSPGQEALAIVVNAEHRHLRFRYLHMNPKAIDEDGFLSGRVVRAGDVVGKVSNYSGGEAGTSHHVHFDMQVFTRDGWVLVNPYMTLVEAYERLIGARGEELNDLTAGLPTAEVPHPALTRKVKQRRKVRYRNRRHAGRN